MIPQHPQNKIAELELWLMENPDNENRTTIETDLRKLKESEPQITIERDTLDIRDYNIFHL